MTTQIDIEAIRRQASELDFYAKAMGVQINTLAAQLTRVQRAQVEMVHMAAHLAGYLDGATSARPPEPAIDDPPSS